MHDSQDTRVRASPSCSSFIHVISPTLLTISVHFLTFPTLILLILPFCPYIHYIYLEQQLQSQFVGCCRRHLTTTRHRKTKNISQPVRLLWIYRIYTFRFYHCIVKLSSQTIQEEFISDPVGVNGNIGEISWWMTVWKFADVALFLLSSTAELDSLVMAGFSNYTFTNLKIIYQFSSSSRNDDGDQQLFSRLITF